MKIDFIALETELKKRHQYPYKWYRKQNNIWDTHTNFVYKTQDWEALLKQIALSVKKNNLNKKEMFYYAINRWYNFWSAMAIEQMFCTDNYVVAEKNKKHRSIDFWIKGIPFDHKTSVYPKSFNKKISTVINTKKELIYWLYNHQSKEQRYHLKNRLFIVVYCNKGEHWKLKAALTLLQKEIKNYLKNFNPSQLQKFIFTPPNEVVSDIIWLIK